MTAQGIKVDWWTAPRLWPGETAYIVGGGPSLIGFNFAPLHDQHVIGCNDAYMLGPWVDACLFGDIGWWRIHWQWRVLRRKKGRDHPGLLLYAGLLVTNTPPTRAHEIQAVDHLRRVKCMRRAKRGVKHGQDVLVWYHNVGAAAIHLALLFGARRIVLLGYDMKRGDGGRNNWHNNIKPGANPERLAEHKQGHALLKEDMDGAFPEVEVLNATPGTALDVWPKVDWREVAP